jgi:hypothetical protein
MAAAVARLLRTIPALWRIPAGFFEKNAQPSRKKLFKQGPAPCACAALTVVGGAGRMLRSPGYPFSQVNAPGFLPYSREPA